MKKTLSVFLAVLILFTTMTIAALADEETTEPTVTAPVEERTTRDITNDDGMVVPINFWQLKQAFFFKLYEKVFKIVKMIFSGSATDSDQNAADIVKAIGEFFDKHLAGFFA